MKPKVVDFNAVLDEFNAQHKRWGGLAVVEASLAGQRNFRWMTDGRLGVAENSGYTIRPATDREYDELENGIIHGRVTITCTNRISRATTVLYPPAPSVEPDPSNGSPAPSGDSVSAPPQGRYHGFTCPRCGSHLFSTSLAQAATENYPAGASVGMCTEHAHTGNGCTFDWNRDDVSQEALCVYASHPQSPDRLCVDVAA